MQLIPIILSGGSGSRLWPLSRNEYPKQIIHLLDHQSLFQATLQRAHAITPNAPVVVANYAHRFLIAEQADEIQQKLQAIILEPIAKNTAPALALAALYVVDHYGDGILWVMPADHVVQHVDVLKNSVERAKPFVEQHKLVTFGVPASRPDTNYGYIERGQQLAEGVFAVKRFVEKPNRTAAEQYLEAGNFDWNSGMFLFTAKTYLQELAQFAPGIVQACQKAYQNSRTDLNFLLVEESYFAASASDSIDYAVMEKTSHAVVVPTEMGWSDVGSWASLADALPKDENENVTQGDVLLHNVKNSYIRAENKLVAAVGLDNHVIVETHDAVLVAHKNDDQNVKKIVEQLKKLSRNEAEHHVTIYRPWGSHTRLIEAPGVRVNRIIIKPAQAIALQTHQHRAEHWVVVKGLAEATCGDKMIQLVPEQSTFIPRGQRHRFRNVGTETLEVIEVQTGDYLGEDDVVRV